MLMASRTAVSSSNDRYANLETNFLLQRFSVQRHSAGYDQRCRSYRQSLCARIEVIVRFRAPDQWQRYQILRMHLRHAVDDGWLQELACRCELTGGQLRNAVMARLLAMMCRNRSAMRICMRRCSANTGKGGALSAEAARYRRIPQRLRHDSR